MRKPTEDDADAQTVPQGATLPAGSKPIKGLPKLIDFPLQAVAASGHDILAEIRDDQRQGLAATVGTAADVSRIAKAAGRVAVGCLLVLVLVALLALALGALAAGRIWWGP